MHLLTIQTWKACIHPGVSSSAARGAVIRRKSRKSRWCKPTFCLAEESPIDPSCYCRSRSSIVPRSLRRREINLLTQLRFPQRSVRFENCRIYTVRGLDTDWKATLGPHIAVHKASHACACRRVSHTCATLGTCAYTVTPKKNARVGWLKLRGFS